MAIRYSSVVGGSGGTGFNLDIGASGNTTFEFATANPAGGYSITSQLADTTIEFYAIAEDGSLAGYTNTKALAATKDFNKMVVYGATANDLITFEFKPTTLPTGSGNLDSGAAPYITSISDADLASVNDTTIISGGNFASNVSVTFTGTDNVVRNAKSIVRSNSSQLIVTRPDDLLVDYSPYEIEVLNPGIPQSVVVSYTSSVTVGAKPIWSTSSGTLPYTGVGTPYSFTLAATDESSITYTISSGQLPSGLSINSSTGEISGTVSQDEGQTIVVTATDDSGNTSTRQFNIATRAMSGGAESVAGGYAYHTFTSSSTATVLDPTLSVDILVVGGGGGGGGYNGAAGGGAGGMISLVSQSLAAGSYPVIVGAGGNKAGSTTTTGTKGTDSSINSQIAYGGGVGETQSLDAGTLKNGGSGGGAAGAGGSGTLYGTAGTGISGQGNNGGRGWAQNTNDGGGGGGGAGAAGANGYANHGGNGGAGLQWLNGTYYAGGGGGGSYSGGATTGGIGGGGAGGTGTGGGGVAGTANTGGGGGGSSTGQNGGSGIVIVRYPV